jgi:hypothetical protein
MVSVAGCSSFRLVGILAPAPEDRKATQVGAARVLQGYKLFPQ